MGNEGRGDQAPFVEEGPICSKRRLLKAQRYRGAKPLLLEPVVSLMDTYSGKDTFCGNALVNWRYVLNQHDLYNY